MKIGEIDNVELTYLSIDDYAELKEAMILAYQTMSDAYWNEDQIDSLISKFGKGQVVIKINGKLAGCALSIIVDYDEFSDSHTCKEITQNYSFNSHNDNGDMLYGIDVFIKEEFRGLRLGRRLYDYRKELCEQLNLRGIAFGGRIPNYHKYQDKLTAKEYIERVKRKEINDPVLNFQISNDFHPVRVMKGYL